jgi:Ca2+-binding EF-hand superfamily protein
VLGNLGHTEVTPEQVQTMLKKVDKNADGVIEWEEFLDMMQDVKHKDKQNFG